MIHLGRVKDYITHTFPLSLGDSSCRTEKPLRVRVEPGKQKRIKEHEQNNPLEGQSNKQKPPFTLSPFSPQSFNVNSPPVPRAHMHLTNWQTYVAGEYKRSHTNQQPHADHIPTNKQLTTTAQSSVTDSQLGLAPAGGLPLGASPPADESELATPPNSVSVAAWLTLCVCVVSMPMESQPRMPCSSLSPRRT